MRFITFFALPVLLAGQGMIHCMPHEVLCLTCVNSSGSGLEHRRWWFCREHLGQ